MKYLKRFNESVEKLYHWITFDEWLDIRKTKVIDMESNTIRLLDEYANNKWGITNTGENIDSSKKSWRLNGPNQGEWVVIHEAPDEYFYVELSKRIIPTEVYLLQQHFMCDQLEGVFKLLDNEKIFKI